MFSPLFLSTNIKRDVVVFIFKFHLINVDHFVNYIVWRFSHRHVIMKKKGIYFVTVFVNEMNYILLIALFV